MTYSVDVTSRITNTLKENIEALLAKEGFRNIEYLIEFLLRQWYENHRIREQRR